MDIVYGVKFVCFLYLLIYYVMMFIFILGDMYFDFDVIIIIKVDDCVDVYLFKMMDICK